MVFVSGASRPHCVHIRWVPGWVKGVCGVAVEAFVEVAVYVEDGLDAGVSKSRGDDSGVGALSDQKGDMAVPEIVKSHRLSDGVRNGGEPEAATERVASDGSASGRGEDQTVRAWWMVVEVLVDDGREPGRN